MMKVFTALFISFITVSTLSAQTPFYQGKTVQIRVGFAAGGAFDVWARVIASHLGPLRAGKSDVCRAEHDWRRVDGRGELYL